MLLITSELGASRKKDQRVKKIILDLGSKGAGGHFDCTHAQEHFAWMHRVLKKCLTNFPSTPVR
jgi:hypothetical protein